MCSTNVCNSQKAKKRGKSRKDYLLREGFAVLKQRGRLITICCYCVLGCCVCVCSCPPVKSWNCLLGRQAAAENETRSRFSLGFTAKTAVGSLFSFFLIRHILLLLLVYSGASSFLGCTPGEEEKVVCGGRWRLLLNVYTTHTRRKKKKKKRKGASFLIGVAVFFSYSVPLTQPAEADGCFYGPVH